MRLSGIVLTVLIVPELACASSIDFFGAGSLTFEIEFVVVGDPGNAGMPLKNSSVGAVDDVFRMARYEIPEAAVAAASALGDLGIRTDGRGASKPATSVSWRDALRFINWLNEDAGAHPAYRFDLSGQLMFWDVGDPGYSADNPLRNSYAHYFLPTLDEWWKAAHYDPSSSAYFDWATGSNDVPIAVAEGTDAGTAVFGQPIESGPAPVDRAGGLSPFGTVGQSGNVAEWVEDLSTLRRRSSTASPTQIDQMSVSGFSGNWASELPAAASAASGVSGQFAGEPMTGFRIASRIPEPCAVLLGSILALVCRARKTR